VADGEGDLGLHMTYMTYIVYYSYSIISKCPPALLRVMGA
jgi:hypothetical protein